MYLSSAPVASGEGAPRSVAILGPIFVNRTDKVRATRVKTSGLTGSDLRCDATHYTVKHSRSTNSEPTLHTQTTSPTKRRNGTVFNPFSSLQAGVISLASPNDFKECTFHVPFSSHRLTKVCDLCKGSCRSGRWSAGDDRLTRKSARDQELLCPVHPWVKLAVLEAMVL